MLWWWGMDRILPAHTEIMKYAFISWLLYLYLGTIFLAIFKGFKVDVSFVGKKKRNKRKVVTFNGRECKERDFVWIMGCLVAIPFVSGLIMNSVDPKNGGLVYAPFLMYHIVCFIKDIPLSTIKLLPYLANSRGYVPPQQWSALSINSGDDMAGSSNTYRYTYRL